MPKFVDKILHFFYTMPLERPFIELTPRDNITLGMYPTHREELKVTKVINFEMVKAVLMILGAVLLQVFGYLHPKLPKSLVFFRHEYFMMILNLVSVILIFCAFVKVAITLYIYRIREDELEEETPYYLELRGLIYSYI